MYPCLHVHIIHGIDDITINHPAHITMSLKVAVYMLKSFLQIWCVYCKENLQYLSKNQ